MANHSSSSSQAHLTTDTGDVFSLNVRLQSVFSYHLQAESRWNVLRPMPFCMTNILLSSKWP